MELIKFWLQLAHLMNMQQNFNSKLSTILKAAQSEHNYRTILYAASESELEPIKSSYESHQLLRNILTNTSTPIVVFNSRTSKIQNIQIKENLLVLVEMQAVGHIDSQLLAHLLAHLWRKIKRNTQSHTVLIFKRAANEHYIKAIMKYCVENKAMNTIAITKETLNSDAYYSLKVFPRFEVKIKSFENNFKNSFPAQVTNMAAHPLRLLVPNVIPKTYFYTKPKGERLLSGYIGKLFVEYAKKHNATLNFAVYGTTDKNVLSMEDTDRLVANNSVDMAAEIAYLRKQSALSLTHLYDSMDWCVMVPVEQPLPSYIFYLHIFDAPTVVLFLLSFVLLSVILKLTKSGQKFRTSNSLQLLQQNFVMKHKYFNVHSFIFIITYFTGLIFDVSFSTYLQTYKASPPTERRLETIDDLKRKGVKILIQKKAYQLAVSLHSDIGETNFEVIDSYKNFIDKRSLLDMKNAYAVATPPWIIYQEQQKYFERPRFRLSNICLGRDLRVMLPLQLNSIYLESLNNLIQQLQQAGLVDQWKRLAFYELWAMHKFQLVDPTKKKYDFKPMKLYDLYVVFIFFILALFIVFICFLLELWCFRRKLNKFRKPKTMDDFS